MTFSQKLKELRKEKNLTQENLAKAICVSRTLITKYESGAVYPTEDNLHRLAEYFNVDVKELISDEEKTKITLDMMGWLNVFRMSLFILFIVLSITFMIVLLLPVFEYGHYLQPGTDYVYGNTSILTACFKRKNYIGLISFIISLSSSGVSLVCLFKNKKIIYLIALSLFALSIIFFIFSLFKGIAIINSNNFSLNSKI